MLFLSVMAQHTIIGKIVDENNQPLEFVVVTVIQNDSTIKEDVAKDGGLFSLNLPTGNFALQVIYFGKVILNQALTVSVDTNLGELKATVGSLTLGEFVFEDTKNLIERKVDRLVFNVENTVAASGGDALDLLKVTPGLKVQNNQISMVGKSNMLVMINDRVVQLSGDDLINFLKSISADDIKNIEVITTPPAKYEAEGNSGLINISYKSGRKNSWSNSTRTTYTQTTYPAISLGNSFNYNKNKLALSTSIDAKKGSEVQIITLNIFYPNETWSGINNSKNAKDFVSGRLSVDYAISEKSSIGFQYLGNKGILNNEGINIIDIYNSNSMLNTQIRTPGINNRENNNNSGNVHFLQTIDTNGRKLSVDLDYFNYNEKQNRVFTSNVLSPNEIILNSLSANNISDQKIENYSAKIDVEHPFKWVQITYGAKTTFTNTNSLVEYYDISNGTPIFDPLQSDVFNYKENTQAIYADAAKSFGKKWQTKLGARVENSQTEGLSESLNATNKNDYTKLFPSAFILYNWNDSNSININYSKRIQRPDFRALNPFRWYFNSTSYAVGNPFLQPSFSDNIELTHTYKQKLITTLFVSIRTNGYSQVPIINVTDKQQAYMRLNYFTEYVYGLSESYIFIKYSWWESYNQATIFYNDYKINHTLINTSPLNGTNIQFATNNRFKLNKKKTIFGELNFAHSLPIITLIYEVASSSSLDLAIKVNFMNDKLQCSFTVNDILRTSAPDATTYTNGIKQIYNTYSDNRYFKIGLNYSFGNNKINSEKRNVSNEEELNRTN